MMGAGHPYGMEAVLVPGPRCCHLFTPGSACSSSFQTSSDLLFQLGRVCFDVSTESPRRKGR